MQWVWYHAYYTVTLAPHLGIVPVGAHTVTSISVSVGSAPLFKMLTNILIYYNCRLTYYYVVLTCALVPLTLRKDSDTYPEMHCVQCPVVALSV